MRVVLIEIDQNMINKIKSVASELLVFDSWKKAHRIILNKDYDLLIVNYELIFKSNINLLEEVFELNIEKEIVTIFESSKYLKKCYKKSLFKDMNLSKINTLLSYFAPKNVSDNIIISLNELGISSRLRGYFYLKEAINIVINKNKINITKDVYPLIANQYKTTNSAVERAIRNAIEIGWTRGNIKKQEELFNNILDYNQDRPTNKEYIFVLADYLKGVLIDK